MTEEPQAKPKKINKTPQAMIDKASASYHNRKNEILKMAALKNICVNGRLPFETTIVKHQLSWEDIAHCLQSYITDNPAVNTDIKQRLMEDRQATRDYHKFISSKRNTGNRDDDLTILNKVFINAYDCDMCKTPFHGKRKVMNADEQTGHIQYVLCVPCSIGAVEKATENLTNEIKAEAI